MVINLKFDKDAFKEKSSQLAEEVYKQQVAHISERLKCDSTNLTDLFLFFFKESQDFAVEFSTRLVMNLLSDLEENEKSS